MMILSFAWTTPAAVLGVKNVTRRDWTDDYFERMVMAMRRGELLQAYDKSPRCGGKCFGTVQPLSMTPELTCLVPPDDWKNEGFEVLTRLGLKTGKLTPWEIWEGWRKNEKGALITVRFEPVVLNDYGKDLQKHWRVLLNTTMAR